MSKIKSLSVGLYQHYKGPLYRVIDVATHSESEELLVIYQALYGEKGIWARPLKMFTESVEIDGQVVPRFGYCDAQTAVLEVVNLQVKAGQGEQFEKAFKQAQCILERVDGYMHHQLQKCLDVENNYLLFVNWQTLEAHTQGFNNAELFDKYNEFMSPFYQSEPTIKHHKII